jgi:hypothetical protein
MLGICCFTCKCLRDIICLYWHVNVYNYVNKEGKSAVDIIDFCNMDRGVDPLINYNSLL